MLTELGFFLFLYMFLLSHLIQKPQKGVVVTVYKLMEEENGSLFFSFIFMEDQ